MESIKNELNAQTSINFLDQEDWKIVKEINIISTNQYGVEISIGTIVYNREITDDYKLKEDPEPNQFKRLLNYPKQELFTHDDIDELILSAVKSKFPKSYIMSHQIFWDSDEKRFEHLLKRPKETAVLEIRPNFSGIDIYSLAGKSFPVFRKEINIYQDFTLESIKSHFFTANCDFDKRESLIPELYKIVFK